MTRSPHRSFASNLRVWCVVGVAGLTCALSSPAATDRAVRVMAEGAVAQADALAARGASQGFQERVAYDRMSEPTLGWDACLDANAFGGAARVVVTFAPSGRTAGARVDGAPFAGTPTGECIASKFEGIVVPPFAGDSRTVAIVVVKPAPEPRR